MSLVIIKYNGGNTSSVAFSLKRLGLDPVITDDAGVIKKAEKVIFPGVGDAGAAMRYLTDRGLDRVIKELTCPVLGICLGMQLMCSYSDERDTECLGIFDQPVHRFDRGKKVPHVGWNKVKPAGGRLSGDGSGYFYFVHSYYTGIGKYTTMTCDYIGEFSAGMERDNFFGVQFHPEKSGRAGEIMMRRFIGL